MFSLTEHLIASFRGSSQLVPEQGALNLLWTSTNALYRQTLRLTYQIECDDGYFGDKCITACTPRDDELGHYECGEDGEKVCKQGWQGEYCTKG